MEERLNSTVMDATTGISEAPAPWELCGRAYISVLRFDPARLDEDRHLAPSLRGRRVSSPYAFLMFVDYSRSAVGPYHELLFIPGRYTTDDQRRYFSISRIFVSSMDSVVNGRRNWGIPKDIAQFDVRYGDQGLDRVRLTQNGRQIASLDYRRTQLSTITLPVTTALLPSSLRTLVQHQEGRSFHYAPSARGWIQHAKLVHAESDPELFPDLAAARPLLTVQCPRFRMRFPVARVSALRSETRAV